MKKLLSIMLAMLFLFTGTVGAFATEYYVEEETVYMTKDVKPDIINPTKYYEKKVVTYGYTFRDEVTGDPLGYGNVTVTFYYDGSIAYIDNYTKKASSGHPDYRVSVSVSQISRTHLLVTVKLVPLGTGSTVTQTFDIFVYHDGSSSQVF